MLRRVSTNTAFGSFDAGLGRFLSRDPLGYAGKQGIWLNTARAVRLSILIHLACNRRLELVMFPLYSPLTIQIFCFLRWFPIRFPRMGRRRSISVLEMSILMGCKAWNDSVRRIVPRWSTLTYSGVRQTKTEAHCQALAALELVNSTGSPPKPEGRFNPTCCLPLQKPPGKSDRQLIDFLNQQVTLEKYQYASIDRPLGPYYDCRDWAVHAAENCRLGTPDAWSMVKHKCRRKGWIR